MILKSLTVRHFKGIPEATFDGLSDRLNLFSGPNEAGKSTLVEAMRVGLFERSSGSGEAKTALQTWGGSEAPEVEIAFEDDDGEPWWVTKRFVHRPKTTLSNRNQTLEGDAAEKKLREIFQTLKPSTRGLKPEDLGIWRLLWVQQGDAGTPTKDATNPEARDALSATLAERTGEAAAGPLGNAVKAKVEAEYGRFWTATGKRRSDIKAIQDEADVAEAALVEAKEAFEAGRRRAIDLARAREDVAALAGRVDAQRAVAQAAEAAAAAAAEAGKALEVQEQKVLLADQARTTAETARVEAAGLRARRANLEPKAKAAAEAAVEAEARVEAQAKVLDKARARAARAKQAEVEARTVAERAERAATAARDKGELDRLVTQLAEARTAEEALRSHDEALATLPVDDDALAQLEACARDADRARDRLEAASAHLEITASTALTVDGEALAAGASTTVTATGSRTVVLDGVATLALRAGADGIDALEAEVDRTAGALAARLAEARVDSLDAARAAARQRASRLAQRAEAAARLEILAPDGVAELKGEVTQRREALAAPDDDAPPLDEARAAHVAARSAWDAAEEAVEIARRVHTEAKDAWVAAREEARQRADALAHVDAQLVDRPEAAVLAEAAEAAGRAHREAVARRDTAAEAFEAAGGADATRTRDDERKALDKLLARHDARREEARQLQAELKANQHRGLHDAYQDAQARLDAARAEADRVTHEAAVREALHEAVQAAHRDLRERFVAPVREAIEDSVGLLFPGSSLAVDDEGDVVGLQTGGVVEHFETLSGGAREQFGVLVRLGLARVLAGEGRLPLVLDDALVNSDAIRRGRMVEVLRRAADHLQLLVFTCHDEDFDRLAPDWEATVKGRPART